MYRSRTSSSSSRQPTPLLLIRDIPIVSSGVRRRIYLELVLIIRTFFLPDPTALETPLLPTTLVIALDEGNKACLVRHEGKGGMNGQTGERVIDQAWSAAEERIKEIRRILDESTGS